MLSQMAHASCLWSLYTWIAMPVDAGKFLLQSTASTSAQVLPRRDFPNAVRSRVWREPGGGIS